VGVRGGLALLGVVWVLAAGRAAAAEGAVELRMATVAPQGSAWAKAFDKGAREVERETAGRVKLKYFYGAAQGGERDVVRKLRQGTLDGAAVTAVGLGLIKGSVRVLELPFLFRSDAELDHVRRAMQPELEQELDDAGFVLLGWGDVGWIHFLSNRPVTKVTDLAQMKIWAWLDDPIVRALLRRIGVAGVPLDVPDVLSSLQEGVIDACYGSPLAALAFGWHGEVRYAADRPIAYGVGALLVRKESWARVSEADQAVVRTISRKMEAELQKALRAGHARAKKAMVKAGIKFTATPPATVAELEEAGRGVWEDLADKVYSRALLDTLLARIAEVRK